MSYTMEEYARMLADPVRAPAYLNAVRESVREGMVVADVGAGPGVLGIYAATLGARRVFLVEPDASVNAAHALAAENGVADRVEVIRARSTEIELPERAEVIVSDLRGVTPFHGRHLESAADIRMRLLAPGGVCIPRRDRVFAALVDDDALYARTVGAWSGVPDTLSRDSLTSLMANVGRKGKNAWPYSAAGAVGAFDSAMRSVRSVSNQRSSPCAVPSRVACTSQLACSAGAGRS